MEEGVDFRPLRTYLESLQRRGKLEWREAQLAVATASAWPRARIRDLARPQDFDPTCQRCDTQADETDLHRTWRCPATDALGTSRASDYLKERALRSAASQPALWLRGLPPASWTAISPAPDEPLNLTWGGPLDE